MPFLEFEDIDKTFGKNNVISKTAVENPFVIEEHLEFSKSELEVQRVPFR